MPSGIATDKTMPYGIGSDVLPGFSKLIEECGEVLQEVGKTIGLGDLDTLHWDLKGTMRPRLEDEIADLMAALYFVLEQNKLDTTHIAERMTKKLAKFERWHKNIQEGRNPNDNG